MHQLGVSARRIWSDSICGGFGYKTATVHSSFERISKGRKNSNQNCELDCESDCESKLTDRQKVILSILMSDGEKTASWIASQLGLGLISVQSDLSYLRNSGFIKKASKSTHSAWIVLKKS